MEALYKKTSKLTILNTTQCRSIRVQGCSVWVGDWEVNMDQGWVWG